jgi:hypothetical protein
MPIDPTAGRSAGTPRNAELDPMGRADIENARRAFASLDRELEERRGPTEARLRPRPGARSRRLTRAKRPS